MILADIWHDATIHLQSAKAEPHENARLSQTFPSIAAMPFEGIHPA
jgi:hypothetical protein